MDTFKLLQITDCHLGERCHDQLLGLDTDQSLHDVLHLSQSEQTPDMILATGDISGDASPASYARFLNIVNDYFPDTPLAWLPGNHDEPSLMQSIAGFPITQDHRVGGWNMIFLNSCIPNQDGGRIGQNELHRLERLLTDHSDTPTAIFLHHQPVPVGSTWIDSYVLEDADAFFALIDRFDNIKLVSWGHVHQHFHQVRKGVDLIATPSTCVQFCPGSKDFKVDNTNPGYRFYEFDASGKFTSRIQRTERMAYSVDVTAAGY